MLARLEELLCSDLTKKALFPAGIAKEDFAFAEQSRQEVDRAMKNSGAKSDSQLRDVLRRKTRSLQSLDPYIVVELAEYEALCGEGSERRLLKTALSWFPNAETVVDPSDVAQGLSLLLKSQQCHFACQSAQSKVATVQKWVSRVVADQEPQMALASDCALLAEISARFQFFLRVKCNDERGGQELTGLEGLQELYDELSPKVQKSVPGKEKDILERITPLAVFQYLAPAELSEKITALVAAVHLSLGKDQDTKKPGAASSSSGPGGAKSGKKAAKPGAEPQDDSAKAAKRAMALFGC